jgi:hypothetical protein
MAESFVVSLSTDDDGLRSEDEGAADLQNAFKAFRQRRMVGRGGVYEVWSYAWIFLAIRARAQRRFFYHFAVFVVVLRL